MTRLPAQTRVWHNPRPGDPGATATPQPKPSAPSPIPLPYPVVVKPKSGAASLDDDHDKWIDILSMGPPINRSIASDDDHNKWIDILSMGPPIVGPQSADLPRTRHYVNLTLKRGTRLVPGERYTMLRFRGPAGAKVVMTGAQVLRVSDSKTLVGH